MASADAAQRVVEHEVVVSAPRAEVWHALTTNEGVTTFFAPNASVELRLGGPYEIYFVPDSVEGHRGGEGCEVLSYVENEMLAVTWNAPPRFPEIRGKRTFVVFQLEDAGENKTRVKLTNGGYQEGEQWGEVYEYFNAAWPRVLANLKKRFETGPLWSDGERMNVRRPDYKHYCYFLHPARADFFERQEPTEREPLEAHVKYVRNLATRDRLITAGPCTEPTQYPSGSHARALDLPTPGIVIFKAVDDAEAKQIMENDPAVKAGVFKARVNAFVLAFQRP
jgi:uncharacterized protein YndB with AHSA1/START domain/uncharacterized protein YciI